MRDLGQASAHLKKLMEGIGVRGLPGTREPCGHSCVCLQGKNMSEPMLGLMSGDSPCSEDLRAKAGMGQVNYGAGSK